MKRIGKIITLCMVMMCMLSLSLEVCAKPGDSMIYDEVGILSDEEKNELENRARKIEETYHLGVYIVVIEDYYAYPADSVQEAAESIYRDYNLGYGENSDGFMLMLSMSERDYWLLAHGDYGNESLTDYGKDKMADEFLNDFSEDEWYAGFSDYLETSERYLQMWEEGTPFDRNIDKGSTWLALIMAYGFFAIVGIVVAAVVCGNFKSQMHTANMAVIADRYMRSDGIRMNVRKDQYLNTSYMRRPIPRSDNNRSGRHGGTTINSGGFSGKGGKF